MTADPQELQWLQRARRGDALAFGELVRANQRFVYNLALRALNDPEEASDAAQEAFLRAWQGLPAFRGDSSFRTWLYRIVFNLCCNRRPRLHRDLNELALEEDTGIVQTGGLQPALEAGELNHVLHTHIAALPAAQRLLVMLRYQQDLSYEEIAGVMNMPLGTVKTGIHRAKQQLRRVLLESEEVVE